MTGVRDKLLNWLMDGGVCVNNIIVTSRLGGHQELLSYVLLQADQLFLIDLDSNADENTKFGNELDLQTLAYLSAVSCEWRYNKNDPAGDASFIIQSLLLYAGAFAILAGIYFLYPQLAQLYSAFFGEIPPEKSPSQILVGLGVLVSCLLLSIGISVLIYFRQRKQVDLRSDLFASEVLGNAFSTQKKSRLMNCTNDDLDEAFQKYNEHHKEIYHQRKKLAQQRWLKVSIFEKFFGSKYKRILGPLRV